MLNRDGHLVNPLQVLRLPPCDDAALQENLLSAALDRLHIRRSPDRARASSCGRRPVSRQRAGYARLSPGPPAGSTRDLVTLLMERSLVELFLELGRRDLCCFIEAGWTDSVYGSASGRARHSGDGLLAASLDAIQAVAGSNCRCRAGTGTGAPAFRRP